MKSFASRFFAFFVFALLCTTVFPTSALARPVIKFQLKHVYLHEAGEAEVVVYFENSGDQGAYVKWTDIDLTLLSDNGQQMWSDAGIRHYVDDVYVYEKNGFRIAILNFTEFINFSYEGQESVVSVLSDYKIYEDVQRARDKGADMIIACPHWGTEYQVYPDPEQSYYSQVMADAASTSYSGHIRMFRRTSRS